MTVEWGRAHRQSRATLGLDSRGGCPYGSWDGRDARRSTILVGFAELAVGQIAEHDGVTGALELLLHFGGAHGVVLAQSLAELLTHFGIAGDDLHVEPEEVAHLVEGGLERLDGFHLGRIGESFHEFGVGGGLHSGAVEFALDHAQIVGNAQNAEPNLFHAFPVLAIHMVLSVLTKLSPTNAFYSRSHLGAEAERFPVYMSFGN